jgi:hypothetical protein
VQNTALTLAHYPTADLRSKSWDDFVIAGAPTLDFMVTLSNPVIGEHLARRHLTADWRCIRELGETAG